MKARAHGLSDVGRHRERNEDALLIDEELGVFAVADGMGGHAAGDVASRTAIELVHKMLKEARPLILQARRHEIEPYQLIKLAEHTIQETCRQIHRLAKGTPAYSGMGCTLTLFIAADTSGVMAHVGDTRLYLFRDGLVDQLSTDHTLMHDLEQRGMPATARQYEHVLTRSLGQQEMVQIDTLSIELQPDDVILMCSDGLINYLQSPAELCAQLAEPKLERIPPALIDLANARGGEDNITALSIRIEATDEEQEAALKLGQSARRRISALREVELFADLPFTELLRLLNASVARRFDAGDIVITAGQPCDQFLIVTDGLFELVPEVGDFKMELRHGRHMGDTMLLVKRACRATMTAKEPGELLMLRGDRFRDLAASRPWLGVAMMMRLARSLSIEFSDLGTSLHETSVQRSSRLFF